MGGTDMSRFEPRAALLLSIIPLALLGLGCPSDSPRGDDGDATEPPTECQDLDGDGFCGAEDCDEGDGDRWRFLSGYVDLDMDGYGAGTLVEDICSGEALPLGYSEVGTDCADDATVVPHAFFVYREVGLYFDADGDGVDGTQPIVECIGDDIPDGYSEDPGTDCDDADPSLHALIDTYADGDGDGVVGSEVAERLCVLPSQLQDWQLAPGTDCDDGDPTVWQLVEGWADSDGDGHFGTLEVLCTDGSLPGSHSAGPDDCDEEDPATFDGYVVFCDLDDDGVMGTPGVACAEQEPPEGCSETAEPWDCADNPAVNSAAGSLWQWLPGYLDVDGDGYGSGTVIPEICSGSELPSGYAEVGADCDSSDPASFLLVEAYEEDADGDGYAIGETPTLYCTDGSAPPGWALGGGDCNDQNPEFFPGAPQYCDNAQDRNCDGAIDCDNLIGTLAFVSDRDGNGYDVFRALANGEPSVPAVNISNSPSVEEGDCRWDPTGQELACTGYKPASATSDVVLLDRFGGSYSLLPSSDPDEDLAQPVWNPTGTVVSSELAAIGTNRLTGEQRLVTIELATATVTAVPAHGFTADTTYHSLDWEPVAGDLLLVTKSTAGGDSGLFEVDVATGTETPVVFDDGGADEIDAVYSWDPELVFFASDCGGTPNMSVWLVNLEPPEFLGWSQNQSGENNAFDDRDPALAWGPYYGYSPSYFVVESTDRTPGTTNLFRLSTFSNGSIVSQVTWLGGEDPAITDVP